MKDAVMKTQLAAIALTLSAGAALADDRITRAGSQPAILGAAEVFTGTALIEPVFDRNEIRDFSIGKVTFLPGARSAWHQHPKGQTLVILSGTGWTQEEGGARQVMNAGDVVWCPPGIRHWHGATDTTAVTHLAVQAFEGDSNVIWQEHVTDAQYLGE